MKNTTFWQSGSSVALISLFLGMGTWSCSSDSLKDPWIEAPGQELRSEKPRITSPEVDPIDLATQVQGNTAFALDLYHQLRAKGDGNLFFSPHSIEVAMAMTWAGAREDTESAMAAALHFELDQTHLHPVFNYIDLELESRGEGAQGADDQGFRLNVVNSIWGQSGYSFLDEFLDVLAEHYDAGLRILDFMADPDAAAGKINHWVEQVTEERIQDLIPDGVLSSYTKMVLVNAIYFNAAWASPFEEEYTQDGPFNTLDGQTVQVPMMHQTVETRYAKGQGYQAVEMVYDGQELAMVILLPDAGTLPAFEQQLDQAFLTQVEQVWESGNVDLTMPRWELKGKTVSLKELLSNLGMQVAFTADADLSGFNGKHTLFIHDVLHQAFVKVNEAGTEAAAATAVIVVDSAAPPQGPEIVLDRPFIYLIKDRPTGQILFVGLVTDPS